MSRPELSEEQRQEVRQLVVRRVASIYQVKDAPRRFGLKEMLLTSVCWLTRRFRLLLLLFLMQVKEAFELFDTDKDGVSPRTHRERDRENAHHTHTLSGCRKLTTTSSKWP